MENSPGQHARTRRPQVQVARRLCRARRPGPRPRRLRMGFLGTRHRRRDRFNVRPGDRRRVPGRTLASPSSQADRLVRRRCRGVSWQSLNSFDRQATDTGQRGQYHCSCSAAARLRSHGRNRHYRTTTRVPAQASRDALLTPKENVAIHIRRTLSDVSPSKAEQQHAIAELRNTYTLMPLSTPLLAPARIACASSIPPHPVRRPSVCSRRPGAGRFHSSLQ